MQNEVAAVVLVGLTSTVYISVPTSLVVPRPCVRLHAECQQVKRSQRKAPLASLFFLGGGSGNNLQVNSSVQAAHLAKSAPKPLKGYEVMCIYVYLSLSLSLSVSFSFSLSAPKKWETDMFYRGILDISW